MDERILTHEEMIEIAAEREKTAELSTSFGGTVEKNIPENAEWIDDAFYIKKTRFGLYTSILKNPLGQHFITGATYEGVLTMSRWHPAFYHWCHIRRGANYVSFASQMPARWHP